MAPGYFANSKIDTKKQNMMHNKCQNTIITNRGKEGAVIALQQEMCVQGSAEQNENGVDRMGSFISSEHRYDFSPRVRREILK